jgi:predicted nuclease with TOPRIM domain
MGSLIEELRRREAAARAEADRLRTRIEELTEELARAEERVSRLRSPRRKWPGYWKSLPLRNRPLARTAGHLALS